jgi:hypothetical protein
MNGTGTEAIIDGWLGSDNERNRYDTIFGCQEFSRRKDCGNAFCLVTNLYNQIDKKWMNRNYKKDPSNQNWRLIPQLNITKANPSKEKQLEKAIATLSSSDWINQVPTASGLFNANTLRKASIDLVHRISESRFEMIELKCRSGTNTPLYAGIEILLYGLLYVHARTNMDVMRYGDKALLRADEINLRVLAPKDYYQDYNLGGFEKTVNSGIKKFVGPKFEIDFKFTAFPSDFQWDQPCNNVQIQNALDRITSVFT